MMIEPNKTNDPRIMGLPLGLQFMVGVVLLLIAFGILAIETKNVNWFLGGLFIIFSITLLYTAHNLDTDDTNKMLREDKKRKKREGRGRKTRPDDEKLEALYAWDEIKGPNIRLADFLEERFGICNGELNVKESTFHTWRGKLREQGLYKNRGIDEE